MKMRIKATMTGSAFLLLSLFLLASCGGGGGGSHTPPPATTVQVVACTGTASVTINAVSNSNFNPVMPPPITANQIVQWNNNSGFSHTVTRTTQPAAGTFDVALNNGTSVCLQFTAAGVFDYFCTIHPNMTGTITVNP